MVGRWLISAGLALAVIGVIVLLLEKTPFRPGRLPGDLVWRTNHVTFYFPWVTCLGLSLLLTLLSWLLGRR